MTAACLLALPCDIHAADAEAEGSAIRLVVDAPRELESITVHALRGQRNVFDVPASVNVIGPASLQDAARWQVNLSETMAEVPGVVMNNRQNYAQDLQMSIRGFGARAPFGVRGVRLYADGVPATMPDGQGQVSHFDLGSAASVEVLRGPFSALYGNAAGGMIYVTTETPAADPEVTAGFAAGSNGSQRYGLKASGMQGNLGYVIDAARFETDGYRQHSAARRDYANAKLLWQASDATRVTLIANRFDAPDAQDPMGLTRAQMEQDPRQVVQSALDYNTRKSVRQTQAGVVIDHTLDRANAARLMLYYGERSVLQFQSTPISVQAPPSNPSGSVSSGVVDLQRHYYGIDARVMHESALAGRPLKLTAGLNYDKLDEARLGYQNFLRNAGVTSTSCTAAGVTCGVMGAQRISQDNGAYNLDQYVQAEWQPWNRLRVLAGLRHSNVNFASTDLLNNGGSGSGRFDAWTPLAGISYSLVPQYVNLYANWGRGFETPTTNELAYRSDGSPGFNGALSPARSKQWEVGAKTRLWNDRVQVNVAWFNADTDQELVQVSNSNGKAVFANAGRTKRDGIELSARVRASDNLHLLAAYTRIDARYRDSFTSSAVPQGVPAGNRMPGIPRHFLYGELGWKSRIVLGPVFSALETAFEYRHVGSMAVDDLNTDSAAPWSTLALRASLTQQVGAWQIREFARVDNLTHRAYAGSVIVNDSNKRYFEPAAGRNWMAGVQATLSFR